MFQPESDYDVYPERVQIRDFHAYPKRYVVRPPYQRKAVWSTSKQQALLDSLFRRYYVPKLVLREVRLGPKAVLQEVVDGQQRITTVQRFFADDLALPKSLDGLEKGLGGRRYTELPEEIREFVDKDIKYDVDLIKNIDDPRKASHQRVATEIFWRLQQGESLNFMEVAHARLSSRVRNFIVKYADDITFDFENYQPIDDNQSKHPFFRLVERGNDRMQHLSLLGRLLLIERDDGPTDIRDKVLGDLIDATQAASGVGDETYCRFSKFCHLFSLNSVTPGRLGRLRGWYGGFLLLEVTGAVGATAHREVGASLQEPIENRFSQISIMQHLAQRRQRLVRREEHRAVREVALVDDAVEHIRRVGRVREVAELIDHKHVRMEVGLERPVEPSLRRGAGELADEDVGPHEARLVAMLDGAIGEGDREMRLPGAARPAEDRAAPLGDKLGPEIAPEHLEAQRGLEGEAEVVDGAEKRKLRLAHRAGEAGLGAVGDFLGDQGLQVGPVGHPLSLSSRGELGVEAPHRRQVEAAQEAVQVVGGRRGVSHRAAAGGRAAHDATSASFAASRTTYSAPIRRWNRARWSTVRQRSSPSSSRSAKSRSTSPFQVWGR